jgi:hypothetical protein
MRSIIEKLNLIFQYNHLQSWATCPTTEIKNMILKNLIWFHNNLFYNHWWHARLLKYLIWFLNIVIYNHPLKVQLLKNLIWFLDIIVYNLRQYILQQEQIMVYWYIEISVHKTYAIIEKFNLISQYYHL